MSPARYIKSALLVTLIPAFVIPMNAQPSYPPPSGDLPNPYRAIPDWAKLPDGRKWGSTAGVAVAPDGKIWALDRCGANEHGCIDSKLDPVIEFDQAGNPLRHFGAGLFDTPHGIYVDKDGSVWVTDGQIHQVIKFSPDGKVLMTLGKRGQGGEGTDVFAAPTNVIVLANGDVLVQDGHDNCKCTNFRIMRFNKDGTFIKQWGKKGSEPGEFGGLHGLALDSKGRLFIVDRTNNRIEIFTQDGKFIAAWEQFGRPSGMAIDKDDNLYVSDSQSGGRLAPDSKMKRGIRIGSIKDGKVTAFIPDPESKAYTSGAEGLAVDRQGNVYAAENGGHDVKKYVKE
jgi:DNA-binding beta-propeller fold protein YncE